MTQADINQAGISQTSVTTGETASEGELTGTAAAVEAANVPPRKGPNLLNRPDLDLIASLVPEGARVLDIGCGDGRLLNFLARNKNVDARGIEISQAGVNLCVARGLSVIQGDADTDLKGYPDGAFDTAILSDTIQATRASRPSGQEHGADRKPRDCLVTEFRFLAVAAELSVQGAYAGKCLVASCLVRNAEHSSVYPCRLRAVVPRYRCQG